MTFSRNLFVLLLVFAQPIGSRAAQAGWFDWGSSSDASVTQVAAKSSSPNVFSKMNSGTKRLANNTKKMFTPKETGVRKSGTTAIHRADKTSSEKPGFFKSLFNPEPPPPPKTIKEWMSLKQVHP